MNLEGGIENFGGEIIYFDGGIGNLLNPFPLGQIIGIGLQNISTFQIHGSKRIGAEVRGGHNQSPDCRNGVTNKK